MPELRFAHEMRFAASVTFRPKRCVSTQALRFGPSVAFRPKRYVSAQALRFGPSVAFRPKGPFVCLAQANGLGKYDI